MNRTVGIVIVAVVAVVLVGGYVGGLVYYAGEGERRSTALEQGAAIHPDRVEVAADLLSVDQVKQEAVIRLKFDPKGDLVGPDELTLAKDVTLFVNSASGSRETTFAKGKIMSPMDVTVDMFNGSITDYPFDKYESILQMLATDKVSGLEQPVPISVQFTGQVHGLNVSEGSDSAHAPGYVLTHVNISRSATTVAVALFVMALLIIVSLSVLVVTMLVAIGGRKLEPPLVGLLGALLFGFVAFRNAMPGTPPIGTLGDFMSFFWAEGLVAACLFVLVVVYLRRLPAREPGKN